MGWGQGIGIGWPMASNSSSANLGYFIIEERCDGPIPGDWTSQLINTNLYNTGDYVDGVDNKGNTFRWLLGEKVLVPGNVFVQISGPAYTSCPGLRYFTITEICGRIGPPPNVTSQLINPNLYNQGDYVDASDNRGNYFRVCLGGIATEPSRNTFTISGPTYTSCTEGLVRYQIIQACNQGIPDGAATQLVNSNLYTYGDYVYSPSFDTRVTLGSIVESFEYEYQIQGPAFSGCE